MSDANIPALLEELREVDADTYREIQKRLLHYMIAPQMDAPIVLDHIQGCIQRAIAARPDHWIISQWMSQDKWQAMIRRGPRGYTDPEYMHIGEGDTPAAAILAAYIEAMRARQ